MASSRRSLSLTAALSLVAAVAWAQGSGPLVLAGRVVRVAGDDSLPVVGVFVVGHHVGTLRQGPVDSVRTDAAGRFRMVVGRPDTSGMYVVSARYQGIGYFGPPVEPGDRAVAASIVLAVFDASTAGPPLVITVRHVVVTAPENDGARRVMDILQVHNGGTTTRVAADTTTATWRMRLPSGIVNVQTGEGEVSPAAVRLEGAQVAVTAPFPPGDKQVVVTYVVPRSARAVRIPIDQPTARLELLVEDPGAEASGAGIVAADPVVLEGRTLRRFTAERATAGAVVRLGLRAASDAGRRFAWMVVLAAGATLAGGVYVGLRRRRAAPPVAAPDDPEALAGVIAALDERYEGREADTPADAWRHYTTRRADLAERVRAALARPASS